MCLVELSWKKERYYAYEGGSVSVTFLFSWVQIWVNAYYNVLYLNANYIKSWYDGEKRQTPLTDYIGYYFFGSFRSVRFWLNTKVEQFELPQFEIKKVRKKGNREKRVVVICTITWQLNNLGNCRISKFLHIICTCQVKIWLRFEYFAEATRGWRIYDGIFLTKYLCRLSFLFFFLMQR